MLLRTAALLALLLYFGPTPASAQEAVPPVLLQMIRDDAVHDELGLSREQREQIIQILKTVDGRWFRSRNMVPAKQAQELTLLTDELRAQLKATLDAKLMNRVDQLERQALGTRMILRADVVSMLGLTSQQVDMLKKAFAETDQAVADIQKQIQANDISADSGNRELEKLKTKERQSLASKLQPEQKNKLGSLTGDTFDFSQVKRMYPLAPELEPMGVKWVQGGPLKLEDLRGKVVAVHFYAFECINCQRNFPHYQAWYKDYADQGLVVIGIQTPETSAERSFEHVAAAVKSDGMAYPVLLDAESSNWNAWSNTMWPTVYLIDKQGFLRRWWQGEMNWQDTPGEQQMRQTVEQLLAE
jgi:thiol-disulfide isomerase/thioredoxin